MMSSERIQEPVENLEDYSSSPPFFGKDKWTIDPTKIVTRPQENTLPTIPEKEPVKTTTKRVRFASYVEVYVGRSADKNCIRYPSKAFSEMRYDNEISLKDERIEELERKLKRARKELIRAHDHEFIIIMLSLVFIWLVMSYDYANMVL